MEIEIVRCLRFKRDGIIMFGGRKFVMSLLINPLHSKHRINIIKFLYSNILCTFTRRISKFIVVVSRYFNNNSIIKMHVSHLSYFIESKPYNTVILIFSILLTSLFSSLFSFPLSSFNFLTSRNNFFIQ